MGRGPPCCTTWKRPGNVTVCSPRSMADRGTRTRGSNAPSAARKGKGSTIAVCGVLSDKDVEGIASELRTSFDRWIIVGLQGARALPPDELAGRVRNVGANVEAVATDVVAGCQAAEALAQPGDRIVVFGSFLTVGPALGWLYTSRPWSA